MVKNTGELKKLSDTYENLSNLLTNFNNLNQAVTNASSPSEINAAIDNLKANTQGLIGEKTNSPAYQAVYLALNAAVGLWNVIAYNVQCGPGKSGQQSVTFEGQPGHNSSSINCNLTGYDNGVSGPLSIDNFKKLNQAYQVLQQALKQGVPTLNNTSQKIEVKVTTQTNGQISKETTTTTTNDAQTLLQEASKMISVLTTNCPWVNHSQGQNGGAPWGLDTTGNVCQVFATEFSAVTSMIKNAQEIVTQAQSLNQQSNQNAPQDFNPYTSADMAFAQNMLNHAQAQAKMLELADQITWGAGCAYVEETITALNNSLAHFGTQAEQIKQSELLARTILDFRGSLSTLNNTYNSITTTASNTPNSPFLKNLISQSTNPNSPEGLKTVYQVNQSAYSQLLSATQELGHNPFRRVGLISSQTNNGAMNGIGVQVGYKQFFGEKRRWGLRYYGFFDYNHAYIKSSFFNSASDVFTYGVGTDVLYNFINDKATKNSKISFGVFGGIALAGTSWLNSQYVNLATFNNFYSAKMNVANFQFLFNLGLRMNLAKNKKKASDHAAQHGMELGVKIPTINTNYYSLLGAQLQYRRLYSVYLNYMFAY
ncbi:hypothetical protein BB416_01245 [Helicobacter pylori]|nr:hypothetical protein BB416_01245 [Helicobacter pylori]